MTPNVLASSFRSGIEAGGRAFLYGYAGRELALSVVIQPAAFTFLVIATSRHTAEASGVLRVALGAGLFSAWAMALGAAAGGLWSERRHGRLLMTSTAPVTVTTVLSGFVVVAMALSIVAFVSVVAVLIMMADVSLAALWSPTVAAALVLHLVVMGVISTGLAPLFAMSEAALQMINPLLYLYAVAAGLFVPASDPLLGHSWISWPIPSYWASLALTVGVTNDENHRAWFFIAVGAVLICLYLFLLRRILVWTELAIRVTGSMSPS